MCARQINDTTPELLKGESGTADQEESMILSDYFQLHVRLSDLYPHWMHVDKHFERVAKDFPGGYINGGLITIVFTVWGLLRGDCSLY